MPKSRTRSYTDKDLEKASYELLQNRSGLPIHKIATKYGIPRSTFRFYLSSLNCKLKADPPSVLTPKEEDMLQEWLVNSIKRGFPLNKTVILDSLQDYFSENSRPNLFLYNRPDKTWLNKFLTRLNILNDVLKGSQDLKKLSNWFDCVLSYLYSKNLQAVLDSPQRIFIADETNLQFNNEGLLTLATSKHSKKPAYATFLSTFSAVGEKCCPLLVFPQNNLPENIVKSVPEEWAIAKSSKGTMTAELFYDYLSNLVNTFIDSENIELPIILFVDGQKTHLSYHLHQLCTKLRIEIFALHPRMLRKIKKHIGFETKLNKKKIDQNGFLASDIVKFVSHITERKLLGVFKTSGLYPYDLNSFYQWAESTEDITSQLESISDSNTITYATFKSIVGTSVIENILENEDRRQNKYPSIIFKLWEAFKDQNSLRNDVSKSVDNLMDVEGEMEGELMPEVASIDFVKKELMEALYLQPKSSTSNQDLENENSIKYEVVSNCKECGEPVFEDILICNCCNNEYHIDCVPKQQSLFYPENPDEAVTLCHLCIKE